MKPNHNQESKTCPHDSRTPDGRKLSSRHVMYLRNEHGAIKNTTTDLYVDGMILRDGKPQMWQFGGGYVELDDNGTPTSWNYYITDHLGSTRMVVDSNNNIKETINYYPFGSEMRMSNPYQIIRKNSKMNLETAGFTMPADSAISIKNPGILMPIDSVAKGNEPALAYEDYWQRYRFSSKELDKQNGLNMYDFGARLFDVAGVPMWTSVDPLAEKYYPFTPYSYCAGDPVNKFDPDGREVINEFDQYDYNVQKANRCLIDKIDEEDNVIMMFAHGIGDGNGISVSDNEKIVSAYGFETFLDKNSEEWKNRFASGKDLIIVLFSCETGAEGKFAQKISADSAFEGVKIVAPADIAAIQYDGSISVYHNKPWIEYTNGEVTNTYNGKVLPGTKEFERTSSWDKTWNKYSSRK